eukprot:scaffold94660_cov68-Phaeocystis_antarctica.AAC.3
MTVGRVNAVPLRCSHHALRPWPSADCGSRRVRRPSGRRPSSRDQCGSTAATGPRRGRPQARCLRGAEHLLAHAQNDVRPCLVKIRPALKQHRTDCSLADLLEQDA